MPGLGAQGPTLEIFQYSEQLDSLPTAVNRPGFAHIAFEVDDVCAARKLVLENGGGIVGDIVTLETTSGSRVTLVYLTDPERNVVELQSWDQA